MIAASVFIVVIAFMLFLPLVMPGWIVLAVGMPAGIGLLFAMWRELA